MRTHSRASRGAREPDIKPAQSHAHLMHAFGIALDKGWFIVDYLLQTGETNDLESIARGCNSG
jgi:hypothetical protein